MPRNSSEQDYGQLQDLDRSSSITAAGESSKGLDPRTRQLMTLAVGSLVGGGLLMVNTSEVQAGVPLEDADDEPTPTPTASPTVSQEEIMRRINERLEMRNEVLGENNQIITATTTPEPSSTPTPTREATTVNPTTTEPAQIAQVPSETPTPGETLVAMAPAEAPWVVPASELGGYQRNVPWSNQGWGQSGEVRIDLRRVAEIGVPLGVHFQVPRGFEEIFDYEFNINGMQERPVYIVGVVASIIGDTPEPGYTEGQILMAVPNRLSGTYNIVEVRSFDSRGTRIATIDENGQPVPLPELIGIDLRVNEPEAGVIRNSTNPETGVVWSNYDEDDQFISFPTGNGPSQIRVGDVIIVRVPFDENNASRGDIMRDMNGGRTNEQVLADITDADHSNDGRAVFFSRSMAAVFQPPTE